MQIAYFDESGDDGFPSYSSPHFVLSTLYLHYLNWKASYEEVQQFRRNLKATYDFPVKLELHTKQFLLNKRPYRSLNLADQQRVTILDLFCDLVASLDVRVINISIVKDLIQYPNYKVLDTAVKYAVQRIENDLDPAQNPHERFMIITDPGRVGKMRKTTRRIQRINYVPSKFSPTSYRSEIKSLIEDPLPKDSKESFFIQLADLVAYVVYQYSIVETGFGSFHNRMPSLVNNQKVMDWMDRLRPSLNLKATANDPYGVVFHPI